MAQQAPTVVPQEMMPGQHPPPQQLQQPGNNYYPDNLSDLTGGLPINLDSLRDGPPGTKPFYPYSTLIRYAIKGSPNSKLLLEDIYYAIESRFPYFRTAAPGWKNSVRHNLSLNPCFEKVPRPLTDRGKGSYWTVNDNVDPRTGVHRVRKKKARSKRGQQTQDDQDESQQIEDIDYPEAGTEAAPNVYQDPAFASQTAIPGDPAGPSRQSLPQPPPFPPPYGTYDPNYGMRYSMPPIFRPDEQIPLDERGNPDWAQVWRKELAGLLQISEEQDKAGMDPEWYRQMLFRVRYGMLLPVPMFNPADLGQAPHGMPGAPADGVQVPEH